MTTTFTSRYGPWALVTGASSGIGEELARQLASRGLSVVVVARRTERLLALGIELESAHGVSIRPLAFDLGDAASLSKLEEATADLDIGLVACNAGYGEKGDFATSDRRAQLGMIDLNCRSTTGIAHAFVPRLVARGRGGLVITASTAAFQGVPFSATYAATKAFDLALAEGLFHELRPAGVDVVALCPGGTETEGPKRTGVDTSRVPAGLMPVGPVVAAALNQLGRGPIAIPGVHNVLGTFATRLVPRRLASAMAGRLMLRVMGR